MKHFPTDSRDTSFIQDEDGAATPLAIGLCVVFIVMGGMAVDFNKAMGERTQMQMATDSAAHAAVYTWEFQSVDTSTDTAMAAITGMLPDVAFRDALQETDIEFGFWDPATGEFTADPTFVEDKNIPLRSAVRAVAELEPDRMNESRNIFLGIIGQDTFTIRTTSTYASYYPPCFNEGFVAQGVVDMQSNSNYLDGFCIHSNTYVSLNQNNFFEPGTVVSMPNLADLDIPQSGFEQNEGLQAALRQGEYRLRILRQLPMMFASLRNGSPKYAAVAGVTEQLEVLWPWEKGNGANGVYEEIGATDTANKTFEPESFPTPNRIYRANCTGNAKITLSAGTFSNFALVTNCPINTSNGTILNEVLIATEDDVSASHLQIGLDDNCAEGGGASIWSYGNFNAAASLQGYGAQMLVLGDIDFAAQANGIEGVSFIAGGVINGTSENDMGFCNGDGTDDFVAAPYFRMVN
jgi:Flp pilus assembly protein TadG